MSGHKITSDLYSHYSTLNGANAIVGKGHQFVSPTRQWVPQQAFKPANWNPQMAASSPKNRAIVFDLRGQAGASQGVQMRKLVTQAASILDAPSDLVFAQFGIQRIQFRIEVSTLSIYLTRVLESHGHVSYSGLATINLTGFGTSPSPELLEPISLLKLLNTI